MKNITKIGFVEFLISIFKKGGKTMGWVDCPCYKEYQLLYGERCDDISCADCPLLKKAQFLANK